MFIRFVGARLLLAVVLGVLMFVAHPATAAMVDVYDNTTNFGAAAYANAGATGTSPTAMLADDITPISGHAGQPVTQFSFELYSSNSATVTITPTAYFYQDNGASLGPGTLIDAITLTPVTLTSGVPTPFTLSSTLGFFPLPSTLFWAGLSFSGADATTLNNIGQVLYAPATIGSSQNVFFLTSSPATTNDNPAGGFYDFTATPPPYGDFYWQFSVTPPVPEPSGVVAVLMGMGWAGWRGRRGDCD